MTVEQIAANSRFDFEAADKVIADGDATEILKLRHDVIGRHAAVNNQLSHDAAGRRTARAELINEGTDPIEAKARMDVAGDVEWRARASSFKRHLEALLSKIKGRLAVLNAERIPSAVCITGGGKTGATAANAINTFVARGCKIFAAFPVGPDLVIITTEPG